MTPWSPPGVSPRWVKINLYTDSDCVFWLAAEDAERLRQLVAVELATAGSKDATRLKVILRTIEAAQSQADRADVASDFDEEGEKHA